MARGIDPYSRTVAWLKIVLPLIALAVLGTVFLINSDNGFEAGFAFSKADLDTLESGSFLTQPQISGMTSKSEPFYLNAERIAPLPDDQNLVVITALSGGITFLSGGWVTLLADKAMMDINAQTVVFDSGGRMETSDGNQAQVATLRVNLTTGEIDGSGIDATGPLGMLSADTYRIDTIEGENRVLWFENNVRMRYDLPNNGK